MLKTFFEVVLNVALFYCISYSAFTFWTARKESNIPKSIAWMILVWTGLFLFATLNK